MAIFVSKGNCYRWTIDVSIVGKARRHIPIRFIPAYIERLFARKLDHHEVDQRASRFSPPLICSGSPSKSLRRLASVPDKGHLSGEGEGNFDLELRPTDHALIVSSFLPSLSFSKSIFIVSNDKIKISKRYATSLLKRRSVSRGHVEAKKGSRNRKGKSGNWGRTGGGERKQRG